MVAVIGNQMNEARKSKMDDEMEEKMQRKLAQKRREQQMQENLAWLMDHFKKTVEDHMEKTDGAQERQDSEIDALTADTAKHGNLRPGRPGAVKRP